VGAGRSRAPASGARLRGSANPSRGGKGLTFLEAMSIVASRLQGGGPTGSKGNWLERLTPASRRARGRAEGPAVQERFLLFRIGDEIYGLGLRGLHEVLPSDGVAGLPIPPFQICVPFTYRGREIPVIRMSVLFEETERAIPATARVLLARAQERFIGLLVDEVLEMAEVDPAQIAPLPALATLLPSACFCGLFTRQDRIILLIDEEGLGSLD
jgi:purine-binding chemotaxis protein CheW